MVGGEDVRFLLDSRPAHHARVQLLRRSVGCVRLVERVGVAHDILLQDLAFEDGCHDLLDAHFDALLRFLLVLVLVLRHDPSQSVQ